MSASSPPGRVVELSHAHRLAAGKLLAIVRGALSKRLGALVNALYEGVDDALFDLAERASNNANQARYFDGMREVRKKRQVAETRFLELASRHCADFEAGKLAPTRAESASGGSMPTNALALVDEAELEETLAIGAMVDKAELRLQRILYPLEQRFSVLAGNRVVDGGNDPIGPKLLCQAFAESIREFDVEVEVRLIVLKLFERYVLAGIDPLYEEVNALLVQAGVLANLRYQAPSRDRREAPAPRPRASDEIVPERLAAALDASAADVDPDGGRSEAEITSLVTELRGLLAQRRSHHASPAPNWIAPAGGPGTATPSRLLGPQELLNALTLMQSELESQVPAAPVPHALPTTAARQVKQHLIDQVRRLGMTGSQPPQLGADEDTIDLVGMLFEYALQDRNLPAPIQAMLGRLQIPYLKVALLDKDFVAHKSHPARRLLDNLAQACVGWSEDSDKDQRLYGKAHDIVVTLLKEFDDDVSIFERLNRDFEDFIDKNRRRAELVERRTTEAARGRERLDGAQRAAAREILSQIGGRNLPATVRDLLTRRWSNYLVLTHLRHGEQSPEWRSATRFIEDFAWSVQPMHDDQERSRLREMTPELERMLRSGLAATGLHDGYLDELWGEVRGIYEQQIAGQPVAETAPGRAGAGGGGRAAHPLRLEPQRRGSRLRRRHHARAVAGQRRGLGAGAGDLDADRARAQDRHLVRVRQGRRLARAGQAAVDQHHPRPVPVREPQRDQDRGEDRDRTGRGTQGPAHRDPRAGRAGRSRARCDPAAPAQPGTGLGHGRDPRPSHRPPPACGAARRSLTAAVRAGRRRRRSLPSVRETSGRCLASGTRLACAAVPCSAAESTACPCPERHCRHSARPSAWAPMRWSTRSRWSCWRASPGLRRSSPCSCSACSGSRSRSWHWC